MKTRDEIIAFLRSNKTVLEQLGAKRIALFGSYAKNESNQNSDIDILVELTEPDFMLWSGILNYLRSNLSENIDLITEGKYLKSGFRNEIQKDIIYA